jgi:hypothetical protein
MGDLIVSKNLKIYIFAYKDIFFQMKSLLQRFIQNLNRV